MTYELLHGDDIHGSNVARMLNYPTRRSLLRELKFDEPITLTQLAKEAKLRKNAVNNNMRQKMDGIFSFQDEEYPVIGTKLRDEREFWLEKNPLTQRILSFVVGEVDKENENSRELEDLLSFFAQEYSKITDGVGIFLLLRKGSMSPDDIMKELDNRFGIEIRYDELSKRLWESRAIVRRVEDIDDGIKYALNWGVASDYEFLISPKVNSVSFDS